MTETRLVWLRNDLRVHDHAALCAAVDGAQRLIVLWCFDPRHAVPAVAGLPRSSARRDAFLAESLLDLRCRLRAAGSELIVREGAPEWVVPDLVNAHGVSGVHFHGEIGSEERAAEDAVTSALRAEQVAVRRHWGRTLYDLDDLPFAPAEMPPVFSPFRRQVERHAAVRAPLAAPVRLPPPPSGIDSGCIEQPVIPADDARAVLAFRGGETAGLTRLADWIWESDALRHYRETRNGLLGADYSSKLSPWLALGCVSPREVARQVGEYEDARVANRSTYWLVFELIWRDFFSMTALAAGNSLFRAEGPRGEPIAWRYDAVAFERWCTGTTGFPFVDANMRELAATGYMSNRGRQNAASFLSGYLGLDWRWGAAWFEQHLLDHDVGSNWGNWAWNSGVGHDPRQRVFDVVGQGERYDAGPDYIHTWVPELADRSPASTHRPWREQGPSPGSAGPYPRPVIEPERMPNPPWYPE